MKTKTNWKLWFKAAGIRALRTMGTDGGGHHRRHCRAV